MSPEYAEIMRTCLGALWTVLLMVGGYILKSNSSKIDKIDNKIEELKDHKAHCVEVFADRERNDKAHKEFYDRLAVHDSQINELKVRLEK